MLSSKPSDEQTRALRHARQYLRFSPRSVAEVEDYLRQRGYAAPAVSFVLQHARQQGWLDDRACAKLLAVRLADHGWAWRAIHEQLLAKRFDPSVIQEIANTLDLPGTDEQRARTMLHDAGSRPSGPASRSRVARRLAQRGFDADLIERLLPSFE